MSIGLQILKNLGLTNEEAKKLKLESTNIPNAIYARDQSGLGYKPIATNYVAEANDVFSRISQNYNNKINSNLNNNSSESKIFLPSKSRKKSVSSLSNEDLASILSLPQ